MSDDTKVPLTYEQGNAISRIAFLVRMPEKIGDISFDPVERATADQELGELRKIIRSYSPMMQSRPRKAVFGHPDNWKKIDEKGGGIYEIIEPSKSIEIRLTPDAVAALYNCLLMMAHPATGSTATPTEMEDVVWPVARGLGLEKQLKKDIKLDQPKARKLLRDDSTEWNAKKEPEKVVEKVTEDKK